MTKQRRKLSQPVRPKSTWRQQDLDELAHLLVLTGKASPSIDPNPAFESAVIAQSARLGMQDAD